MPSAADYLRSQTSQPFQVAAGQMTTGLGKLTAWALYNGGSAVAVVSFYDGTSAAGVLLGQVALQIGESVRDLFTPPLPLYVGLFAVLTNPVTGAVYVQ